MSHSSKTSIGRAFSAGNEPMTPALHWAITRSGLEIIKSGAPTTGNESFPRRDSGKAMHSSFAGVDFYFLGDFYSIS